MSQENPVTEHSPKRFAYIDALRGYAILAVILVHVQGGFPGLPDYLKNIFTQCARGVQLFFVLSALTLMLSWHARGNHSVAFYIRRFFRIAPLFWLAIIVYTFIQGMGPSYWAPNGMSWLIILATFLFVHGWGLQSINSVVPGGWSIAVEMNFYLVFPFIAKHINSLKRALITVIVTTIVAHYSNIGIQHFLNSQSLNLPDYMISSYAMLWFFNQLPSFTTGILVYYLLERYPVIPKKYAQALLAGSFLYMGYLCFRSTPNYLYYFSFAFGTAVFAIAQGAGKFLINRFSSFAGKVSYSGYLCQFIVIDHLYKWIIDQKFAFVETHPVYAFIGTYSLIVLCVLILSYGLHLAVEKPMITFGHRLAKRYA